MVYGFRIKILFLHCPDGGAVFHQSEMFYASLCKDDPQTDLYNLVKSMLWSLGVFMEHKTLAQAKQQRDPDLTLTWVKTSTDELKGHLQVINWIHFEWIKTFHLCKYNPTLISAYFSEIISSKQMRLIMKNTTYKQRDLIPYYWKCGANSNFLLHFLKLTDANHFLNSFLAVSCELSTLHICTERVNWLCACWRRLLC